MKFARIFLIMLLLLLAAQLFFRMKLAKSLVPAAMPVATEEPAPPAPDNSLPEGVAAPDFGLLPDLNDGAMSLSQLRGQVVIVNFWASWCAPCMMEMPSMAKFYQEFKAKGLEILAISVDKELPKIIATKEKFGLTFPILRDPDQKSIPIYRITGYPESYIINRRGILVKKIIGPLEWNDAGIKAFMSSLLNEDVGTGGEKNGQK